MAIAYSGGVTKKEIAEKMNVTPSAFGQRLKTGKFTKEELRESGKGNILSMNVNFKYKQEAS